MKPFIYLFCKKGMKKRKVYAGEVHHVYQRTWNRGLIFYTILDYLVFFTVYCSQAKKREVEVLSLCPMPDHIHQILVAKSPVQLAGFIQNYARQFAWEWNRYRKKKGSLFQHPFDCAAKLGNKHVRTALACCNNNPVERKLTERAQDYRWTFLSYYKNKFPYSLPLNPSRAGKNLRIVLKEIRRIHQEGSHLTYSQLERWGKRVSAQEWAQVTDYIIGLWNVIDYEQAISYYGSFDAMLRAFHDNTGSEYDIKEDRDKYSDEVYADCSRILLSAGIGRLQDIPSLPASQKVRLYNLLAQRSPARPRQIRKYLHLEPATS